ncbi:hypothetical protein [Micromonospora sp. LOL_024]|uniref:hypothetical protein n=1 Tax=Micromonospora sp. LOL_024 TaxID=3345412 RepID=UPI003A8BD383
MRYRPVLPAAAGFLAAVHVVGIGTGVPLLRQAEVAALLLLAAYALTARAPFPVWAVPLALTVLVIDAVATMPVAERQDRQMMKPGPVDATVEFVTGLRLSWAALVVVLVLMLTVRRREARPGRGVLVGAGLAVALVTGHTAVRLVGIHLTLREAERLGPGTAGPSGVDLARLVPAVLAPLALVVGALVLVALLAGHRRRLAAGGAALLALVALTQLDGVLGTVWLPLHTLERGYLFSFTFHSGGSFAAPGVAVAVAAELTAYLLLVVGLCASREQRAEAVGPVR